MSEKAITRDDLNRLENKIKELEKIVTDHNEAMLTMCVVIKNLH